MNRKKKINQTLKAKVKKMNAKQQKSNKPKYISKAERAAIAEKAAEATSDGASLVATIAVKTESSTEKAQD